MGLSASQARLLTITARKSDCEYQSMRYSHQKLSLSRNMTDISNEYQNALDATKLVYDFYGTGDKTNPLSYNLMMTPSELNGYLPLMLSDNSGKIILNAKYAAAAKAAGIPQEGLGCLPSSGTRDAFIQGMAASGLISQDAADLYTGIQYSQTIGNGSTDLATVTTEKMTLKELLDRYSSGELCDVTEYGWDSTTMINAFSKDPANANANNHIDYVDLMNGTQTIADRDNEPQASVSIADILEGNYSICVGTGLGVKEDERNNGGAVRAVANLDIWDWMFEELANMLGVTGDSKVQSAIAYATSMTQNLINPNNGFYKYEGRTKEEGDHFHRVNGCMLGQAHQDGREWGTNNADFIGVVEFSNKHIDVGKGKRRDGVSINLTNIAKVFLTYFAEAIEGIGESRYHVNNDSPSNRRVKDSVLMDINDQHFTFDIMVNEGVNTDQTLNSGFYDGIFNQICINGWRENINIDDSDYMQEMLKTGKLLLNTCSDDGYYYATNYATNTYIREISDEDMVAKAEAKYNTEKQKIEHKEQTLDLKMKNLDTEISSLTTEYDTVKSLISKNIEKGFKRYDA